MARDDKNVGFGLLFPLRWVGDDFEAGSGSALFRARLLKILGTQAASPDGRSTGEYPWRRNFGSQLAQLRHSDYGDLFDDLVQVFATDAIAQWEPLAIVGLVETAVSREGNGQKVLLAIRFSRFTDQTGMVVEPETVETEV